MDEQAQNAPLPLIKDQSPRELARLMREVLNQDDLKSEDHRKAALRRLIHDHAAGLTKEEILGLVDDLRDHFPDRTFESVSSAKDLASRSIELEEQVIRLRKERDDLRRQVDHFGSLVSKVAEASRGKDAPKWKSQGPPSAESQAALMEVAALLFSFAHNQEETAQFVEETLGQDPTQDPSKKLSVLVPGLTQGVSQENLAAIQRRLRALQVLPGALLAGAQQSWKGGTGEILEHLDPKAAKDSLFGIPKYPTILKEVERRFEQFQSQFDSNVEHYYRSRFERVYKDKMEDGS